MRSHEVVRLLAQRNEPSVLEKEAHLERLLDRLQARRPRVWARVAVGAGGALAVAAALLLFFSKPTFREDLGPEFASRGASSFTGPAVRLACVQGTNESRCTVGARLAFEVSAAPDWARYFAAFARRADGAVLWYFPQGVDQSPALERSVGFLEQAVVLGPPHTPGEYEVLFTFLSRPLTQTEIKAALGPELSSAEGVSVVQRRLRLEGPP